MHDGMPAWRQEHARPQLPLPGGKAWLQSVCRNAGYRHQAARWTRGRQRWIRSPYGEFDLALAQEPAPLHLSRTGNLRVVTRQHGTAVPTEIRGIAAEPQRLHWAARAHQLRVAEWG